jgi:uncharacterized membrane protein
MVDTLMRVEMRALFAVALVLLFLPGVQASEIETYKAKAHIEGTDLIENVTLTIVNTKDEYLFEFVYPFDSDVREVRVYDSKGRLESYTEYRTGKAYISLAFRDPVPPGKKAQITYVVNRRSAVSVYGELYILSTIHSLLANVKNFALVLQLPEGYVLPEEGVNVVPAPNEVTSDGRRVIIKWELKEPIPAEFREFRFSVRYERLVNDMAPYTTLLFGTATGILILLLLYRLYSLYSKLKGKDEKPGLADKIDILKEDEQSILKMIIDEEGIEQRKIQDETGFSKAKVSKIISELEKRGAVRKEQIGRKNRLYLAEKLKET